MTPRDYCEQKMQSLRGVSRTPIDKATAQVYCVLSFFAQKDLTDHEFVADLKLMADSAEHRGRQALADAARTVLAGWDASCREPGYPVPVNAGRVGSEADAPEHLVATVSGQRKRHPRRRTTS